MGNTDNQPTGKHSIEGDMVQRKELSVKKDEAETFIGKVLRTLVELKNQCGEDEEMKTIHDSIGLCLSSCYTRQEIEAYMLATHGTAAEDVGIHYDAIVLDTGDLSGGKAYEKQPKELSVKKDEAETFIGKVLRTLVELKNQCGEDEEMKTIHDSIGLCLSRCYTRQEIKAYMLATHVTTAEDVGIHYDAIVLGTGDLSGGKAYEKHSINCARLHVDLADNDENSQSKSKPLTKNQKRRLRKKEARREATLSAAIPPSAAHLQPEDTPSAANLQPEDTPSAANLQPEDTPSAADLQPAEQASFIGQQYELSSKKKMKKVLQSLKLLPASTVPQLHGLPFEDKETVAYMITRELNLAKTKCRDPVFGCQCQTCYYSYWERFASSSNSALIKEIVDAYDAMLPIKPTT